MKRHVLRLLIVLTTSVSAFGCGKSTHANDTASSAAPAVTAPGTAAPAAAAHLTRPSGSDANAIVGWEALQAADPVSSVGRTAVVDGVASNHVQTVTGSPKAFVSVKPCTGNGHVYVHTTNRALVDRIPYQSGCASVRLRLESHDRAGWHAEVID